MKDLVKFILNIFDFFTQQKILKYLVKIFNNKKIFVLIDIGSHKGEYISSLSKVFEIDKIYGFEPNPDVFKILNSKFKDEKVNLLNIGVSNFDGKTKFNKNLESSSSSINELNSNSRYFKKIFLFKFFKLKNIVKEIDIDVIRLEKFLTKKKINKIDLIKIDTEGHELNVLKGIGEKIKDIEIIHFEHHFDDMIIKDYKLSTIHDYLINSGFKKSFKVKMFFRKSFEYIYINKRFE